MTRGFPSFHLPSYVVFLGFALISSHHFSYAQQPCDSTVTILQGPNLSFCTGEDTTLEASGGNVTYEWFGPTAGNQPQLTITQGGQYIVSATDGSGCVSSDTIDVTVFPNPVGVIVSSEGNQLCPGQATTLSLQGFYVAYTWGNGSNQAAIQVNQGGTYVVTVTDLNGCSGNSAITITSPTFGISASSDSICPGQEVTISATGGLQYAWNNGSSAASITVSPSTTSIYTVLITKGLCSESLSLSIVVLPLPASTLDTLYYTDNETPIALEAANGFENYLWEPENYLSNNGVANPTFFGTSSVTFLLTATTSFGCVRKDSIRVIVLQLNVPDGFSPNGDQINDVFMLEDLDGIEASLTIFNRWGETIFTAKPYENNWDGRCMAPHCTNGESLPDGTYFYALDVLHFHREGFIELKR
jgi:gliding motility-associated-like protein